MYLPYFFDHFKKLHICFRKLLGLLVVLFSLEQKPIFALKAGADYFTDGEHFNSQSYNFSGEKNSNQGFLKCRYFDQMIYTRGHLY